MALISSLITEIRTDISDDDSTRFKTDTPILNVIKKAVRRSNRIAQRNGLQFAKKMATLSTVANQDYITLSTIADFDVPIGLYRADTHSPIPSRTEFEWERIISASEIGYHILDYQNDKILFKGTPAAVYVLNFWYYPVIDPSAYTVATSTPWAGRIDDIIMEYSINRLKNIDEMDVSYDTKLLTDLENQLLQAYAPNSANVSEGIGWIQ